MNAQSQTQAILPLTRITFFLSVFVMAWGLFVFTHVPLIVFFGIPIALGILVILSIGEAIAVWTGRRIVISKRVTNRLSILLIVGALLSPGVGFLVGYVQVQMVFRDIGVDGQIVWQKTTLLSLSTDISRYRNINAEFLLLDNPNNAQAKVDEWVEKRQSVWKSEPLAAYGQKWWYCVSSPSHPIVIRIADQYLYIRLDHNTAWGCML